jgi:hypothetical protein
MAVRSPAVEFGLGLHPMAVRLAARLLAWIKLSISCFPERCVACCPALDDGIAIMITTSASMNWTWTY